MFQEDFCPICSTFVDNQETSSRDTYVIDCPRCGNYEITDEALTFYQRDDLEDKVLSAGYWIRKNQSETQRLYLRLDTMRRILVPFIAPKPNEQANNLIVWLGSKAKKPDEYVSTFLEYLIPVIGAVDSENIEYIIQYLETEKYVNTSGLARVTTKFSDGSEKSSIDIQLTFKGWDRFDELKRLVKDSRLAFMAMKFANDTLGKIFNEIIKDAVSKTGFEIRRLDEEKRAGLIDDKLRVEIRRSKFLIADLSDDNNGAYWEAGYAEGLGMPVIYICEESKFDQRATHFDTNHHLTIKWKDHSESLQKFSEELKATIRATFPAEAKMED